MRLIDADRITREYCIATGCTKGQVLECKNRVKAGIQICPKMESVFSAKTVDAVHVVHGHWIMHADELFPPDSTQECSVCHDHITAYIEHFEYCPHCGARMDGETNGID